MTLTQPITRNQETSSQTLNINRIPPGRIETERPEDIFVNQKDSLYKT